MKKKIEMKLINVHLSAPDTTTTWDSPWQDSRGIFIWKTLGTVALFYSSEKS
jgi:hypothetical protein